MAKKVVDKSISDASWNMGSSQSMTVEGLKAIQNSLTPSEAYTLSIDVRAAIGAIANNISKAKLRLFYRKSGDEIIGGPLYDLLKYPAPGFSTSLYITEMILSYQLLGGEFVASMLPTGNGVAGIIPLNPFRLAVQNPLTPKSFTDVQQWRYIWPNGVIDIIDKDSLLFQKNFNPLSHVRGCAPLLAGINEISASYQAVRYNKVFFENNAMPNHLLVLPPGTSRKDREAFKSEYIAMHSAYAGQAHKVMVIEGGTGLFRLHPLEQPIKDGQFLQLQQLSTAKIMELYKVPPVEGGQWDKTHFDSVDIQREVFAEGTLMPIMNSFTEVHQTQLVDRYYRTAETVRQAGAPKLQKYMQQVYEQAREDRVESDIIILLDPDTLPVVAKIKQYKADYALKLQQIYKISPLEAAKEVGMEIPENEANKLVWVQSNEVSVDPTLKIEAPVVQEPKDPALTDEQKDIAEDYRLFYSKLRSLAVKEAVNGNLFRLKDADKLNESGSAILNKQIRLEHNRVNECLKDPKVTDKVEAVKGIFKQNRAFFKDLACS